MNFFKKKDQNAIPPVAPPPSISAPSAAPRYTPQTYVPSRDAGLYDSVAYKAQQQGGSQYQAPQEYNRSNSYGNSAGGYSRDPYTRGGGDPTEQDRNALFGGYKPQPGQGSGRFFDGPNVQSSGNPPGEETEEDIEGIKTQTRYVKQESVNSTRNALRMAREAEETARNTLSRLGEQSGV